MGVSPKQQRWILAMLKDAGPRGLDTLTHHGGHIDKDGNLQGLTSGYGGTASQLIDDLKDRNYRTPTGPSNGGGLVAPPLHSVRGGRSTAPASPAGDRFRANAPSGQRIAPTAEQAHIISFVSTPGEDGMYPDLAVEAGAGTGKTSTLLEACRAMPTRRGLFSTFNKQICVDAERKFPKRLPGGGGVDVRTMHSLAFRATNRVFIDRMKSRSNRIHPDQIARRLGIQPVRLTIINPDGTSYGRRLPAGVLASMVMAAIGRFCQSADREPGRRHFGRQEGIDSEGCWDNHNVLAGMLERHLPVVWADLCDPDGWAPYKPDHYLKSWSLSDPVLSLYDYVLLDEAQDLSPVMMSVIQVQLAAGIQIIAVGDSFQAINEWMGAVDALKTLPIPNRARLTQSFRFGHRAATGANWILTRLSPDFRLVGNPNVDTHVRSADGKVACTLYRTNAAAVTGYMADLAEGGRPCLLGQVDDIKWFCRYARVLQLAERIRSLNERLGMSSLPADSRETLTKELGEATVELESDALAGTKPHPELACFDTWSDVRVFTSQYEDGKEIKLQVGLVDEFGAMEIVRALEDMPNELDATHVHSTAHKVKGREWDTVELADDFPDDIQKVEEADLKLLYVAFTRGKLLIDPTRVGCLAGLLDAVAYRPGDSGGGGLLAAAASPTVTDVISDM